MSFTPIQSPLSGQVVLLSQVPDEVFSQKMVGDGISIDPTDSILVSPVQGTIEFIHPSRHALTIKTANQAEVLIHIGIDTVQLRGEGFRSFVEVGQKVQMGQKLIEFDLDFVATQSKSLITQILISNTQDFDFQFLQKSGQLVQSGKDALFSIQKKNESLQQASVSHQNQQTQSQSITCQNPTGLHARPAAAIVQAAKKYQSQVHIFKGDQKANAKSVVSILSLSVQYQDQMRIEAEGVDAQAAVSEVIAVIQAGQHETETVVAKTISTGIGQKNEFLGVMASPGKVFGRIFQFEQKNIVVQKSNQAIDAEKEIQKLGSALDQAFAQIETMMKGLDPKKDQEKLTIFEAHLELLKDPEVIDQALRAIQQNNSAEYAWQISIERIKQVLSALNNEVMAGRAHDLHDVGQRVLKILLGLPTDENKLKIQSNDPVILVAHNLTPSDMVDLDPKQIVGLVSVEGGASSHVAIIARSMGMAYVAAMPEAILQIANQTEAILNATKAILKIEPTAEEKQKIQVESVQQSEKNQKNILTAKQPATTQDGHHVEVYANVGKLDETVDAVRLGAEGVGLLRSEFLFLHRSTAPSEQEQKQKYQEIIQAMIDSEGARPVIIRTLDVGGDKPLAYLPMPAEENPFLGVRGLRLSLISPEMFRVQIRALLSVQPLSSLEIMFPMVTTLSELIQAKKILQEEASTLKVDLQKSQVKVGIMIEVPSAALMAETFAPHVDFFSIGSNDLTQYTLAIDRGHRDLAAMADGLHPSVLKLIAMTCQAARKHGKKVGVCGGIAGDPYAVPLLIGLGVDELSVSVPVIPHIKAQIRQLSLDQCQKLAQNALLMSEASEVRQSVEKFI